MQKGSKFIGAVPVAHLAAGRPDSHRVGSVLTRATPLPAV
jgi:hypothetical protein